MKKTLATVIGSLSTLAYALPVFAGPQPGTGNAGAGNSISPCQNNTGQFASLCNIKPENIGTIIQTGVTILLVGAVVIALFFLVMGGIRWITSGGDKGKVESARNTIVSAIIGLVIAFLAFFILQLVLSIFGLSLNNITVPDITNTATGGNKPAQQPN